MLDAHGRWYPNLSPKQVESYNDTRRHQLLSGPRISGKTVVLCHKIVKHAWLYDNDRVGIFARSTKIGKIGIWSDLLEYALPEWCKGLEEQGFKITVGPAIDGATRMHYVRIANRHGGESEIQLHSLHHDENVQEKLRSSRFGMLAFDEVDNYEDAEVFNVSVMQLRQIGLPYEKHLWVGTCNPAGDQEHWLYQKWYVEAHNDAIDAKYRKSFGLHEYKLTDNIYLTEEQVTTLKETYRNDPAMYDRYVNGLWVPDPRRTLFAGVFSPQQHIKGDPKEGTVILPTESCAEILVGWDPGNVNHAVSFLEHVVTGAGEYYAVLDEVSHIGQDVSLETLTYEVLGKMDELKALCKGSVRFKHWSDRSALDSFRAASGAKDASLIYGFSNGRIELQACPKGPNSVDARISLIRQLLIKKQLYFSANCTDLVETMKKISRGKNKSEPIKRDRAGHIHRFDSLSYALYGEMVERTEGSLIPKAQKVEPFAL